jgi:AcrR family transcriptional regulator
MAPAQRREQLLDAALSVILEQGYSGISIEAVARAAGVTRPVVYDHFENLERLLQALVEREEKYALEQLENIVPADIGDAHPAALLAGGVRQFLHAVVNRPATWRIILLPPEGTPATIRQHIEKNRQRTLERLEELAQLAIAQPELPDQLDSELTARAIRDLGEEAGRMVLTDPEHYPPERYEQFVGSVLGVLWSAGRADH